MVGEDKRGKKEGGRKGGRKGGREERKRKEGREGTKIWERKDLGRKIRART